MENYTFVALVDEIDIEIKQRQDELNFQNEVKIAALDSKLSPKMAL